MVVTVTASGAFLDDIKEWKKKPFVDRTYTTFRPFMNKAHRSWHRHLTVTAGAHYPRANAMPSFSPPTSKMIVHEVFPANLSESLTNLATTTSANRATMATITDTVTKLSSELVAAQAKIVAALLENQKLLKMVSRRDGRTSGGEIPTPPDGATCGGDQKGLWDGPPIHYCWMYGYACLHSSFRYPTSKPGHIKNVTKKDVLGGWIATYKKE